MMLVIVERLLRFMRVGNLVLAGIFLAFAIVIAANPAMLDARLAARFGADASLVRMAAIGLLLLAATVAVPVHVIFARLIAMLETTRAGRPFIAANAVRLRHIAWALLAIQIADLAYGMVALNLTIETGDAFGWQFSLTGWFAVMLLFVLARVFQQGTAMQDEIEGTV